jgi:asparagine synthase (glutamine-hydrolysing)
MCGIVGIWSRRGLGGAHALRDIVLDMTGALQHRGPDDSGIYIDPRCRLSLGHRRLAIVDLSAAGHQPMASSCGRYVLTYNGELYNHLELRAHLEREHLAPRWTGHSDTETILASFAALGMRETLERCVGMFALALWDTESRVLTLARDRLGEKPLYFATVGDTFVFASELKALCAYPQFSKTIDRDVLALYLRHNCVPSPHTIYRGVKQLAPGTTLTLNAPDAATEPAPYWALGTAAESGQRNLFQGTDVEALDELERLLTRSVGQQMISDVPLGAFLSGGIDSSTIVALMQRQTQRPVRTFTIGVTDVAFNEAADARAVAKHLGTEHTELYVTPAQAMDVIPRLPLIYDEPFADSSQIPTFLVSQLARTQVKVSLSGDGGDELFGGYNRHYWAAQVHRRTRYLPQPLRRVLAGALYLLPPNVWDAAFERVKRILPAAMRHRSPGDKLHKLADLIQARGVNEMYLSLVSHWKNPFDIVRHGDNSFDKSDDLLRHTGLESFENCMMYMDAATYLPNDILTKIDRASMAVGLETRVPMLDHRLVEFAWRLPLSMKIRGRTGKWLLRQLLRRHVPSELFDRPKAGFGVPLGDWLRGPLREWAEELLHERRLKNEGFFRASTVQRVWREHLTGRRNNAYKIWDVLMFQAWLNQSVNHG